LAYIEQSTTPIPNDVWLKTPSSIISQFCSNCWLILWQKLLANVASDCPNVPALSEQKVRSKERLNWKPPSEGWVKYVDGAFYADQRQGATGAVLRDHQGVFKEGGTKWYANCLDVLLMEALDCRDGVVLAQQFGMQQVTMETDCQELVTLWHAGEHQRSSVPAVLREIRELSFLFQNFSLTFSGRNCYRVEHVLAKQVSGSVPSGRWHETPE
jgi:hypothetical protein